MSMINKLKAAEIFPPLEGVDLRHQPVDSAQRFGHLRQRG